ncbi:DeoR/GlpR family DNA-binding transcription regulator [Basfia succiniciproducens]|uniref:Transcriptional regulator, DeoR family n=1 Tax=Basfia succiniciproducens TaxID=653940 RepID=A0A1G5B8K6_9PAST|nr:DeoR/GlpR family DNA-binding transcription regulator [Basfia succiniciproducens]QIM68027.1 DeoR family transcriptional regulator [Basfia succiniciproducens]SCX86488.1 transcriptional regulator, DeoR family [Basfia succiniciproducens]
MNYTGLTGNPRHDKLIALVISNGYISNEELASQLGVTTQTIRRDIRALSQQGLVSRHHGGAGKIPSLINTDFSIRETTHIEEKKLIAQAIADYIPDGSTIFITIGTTVEYIAKALENKNNIRIITNSLRVANSLYQNKNLEVITVGGIVRSHNSGIVSPDALTFISHFRADYLITSVGAIAEDGTLLDFDINEVSMVKAMKANSKKVIVALDRSKFFTSAAVELLNLKDVSDIFTDDLPPVSIVNMIKQHKVKLHIAKGEKTDIV